MDNDRDIHTKIIGNGRVEDGVFVIKMSKHMSKENLNVVDLSAALERAWVIWLVLSMLEPRASCQLVWTSSEYDGAMGGTSGTG